MLSLKTHNFQYYTERLLLEWREHAPGSHRHCGANACCCIQEIGHEGRTCASESAHPRTRLLEQGATFEQVADILGIVLRWSAGNGKMVPLSPIPPPHLFAIRASSQAAPRERSQQRGSLPVRGRRAKTFRHLHRGKLNSAYTGISLVSRFSTRPNRSANKDWIINDTSPRFGGVSDFAEISNSSTRLPANQDGVTTRKIGMREDGRGSRRSPFLLL